MTYACPSAPVLINYECRVLERISWHCQMGTFLPKDSSLVTSRTETDTYARPIVLDDQTGILKRQSLDPQPWIHSGPSETTATYPKCSLSWRMAVRVNPRELPSQAWQQLGEVPGSRTAFISKILIRVLVWWSGPSDWCNAPVTTSDRNSLMISQLAKISRFAKFVLFQATWNPSQRQRVSDNFLLRLHHLKAMVCGTRRVLSREHWWCPKFLNLSFILSWYDASAYSYKPYSVYCMIESPRVASQLRDRDLSKNFQLQDSTLNCLV